MKPIIPNTEKESREKAEGNQGKLKGIRKHYRLSFLKVCQWPIRTVGMVLTLCP